MYKNQPQRKNRSVLKRLLGPLLILLIAAIAYVAFKDELPKPYEKPASVDFAPDLPQAKITEKREQEMFREKAGVLLQESQDDFKQALIKASEKEVKEYRHQLLNYEANAEIQAAKGRKQGETFLLPEEDLKKWSKDLIGAMERAVKSDCETRAQQIDQLAVNLSDETWASEESFAEALDRAAKNLREHPSTRKTRKVPASLDFVITAGFAGVSFTGVGFGPALAAEGLYEGAKEAFERFIERPQREERVHEFRMDYREWVDSEIMPLIRKTLRENLSESVDNCDAEIHRRLQQS